MRTVGVLELKPSHKHVALFKLSVQLCVYGKQQEWLITDGEYFVGTIKSYTVCTAKFSATSKTLVKTTGLRKLLFIDLKAP